jgi:hypothetical protein
MYVSMRHLPPHRYILYLGSYFVVFGGHNVKQSLHEHILFLHSDFNLVLRILTLSTL